MWEQYKKTFRGMQIAILLVTITVRMLTHSPMIAVTFFGMMQGGAIFGAMWGARLRRLFVTPRPGRLPARRT
jgi:hypothetical protein